MLMQGMLPNYIQKSLRKDEDFATDVRQASDRFFNNIKKVFFKNDFREVKVYKNKENTKIYLMEKTDFALSIYEDDIHSFQQDQSISELLKYPLKYLKKDESTHMRTVLCLPNEDSNVDLLGYLNYLKEKGVPGEANVSEKIKTFIEQTNFNCAYDLASIRDFVLILEENKLMNHQYDVEFYKSFTKELNQELTTNFKDLLKHINFFINVCENNNFNQDNKYEFNDLDNYVWLQNGNLVIKDQNVGFYCKKIDDKNYTFYCLPEYTNTEEEIKLIDELIEEQKIDDLKNIALEVTNGKVTFANSSLMYCFNLDVIFSYEAMIRDGYKKSVTKKLKTKKVI